MRALIITSLVFAGGCSTAPVAGLLDWTHPSPAVRPGGEFVPVSPLPVQPIPVGPVPSDVTPLPRVFDPARRREPAPVGSIPRMESEPPPAITTGPPSSVTRNPSSPPTVLPAPAFPDI